MKRVIVEKELLLDLFTVCNHPGCGCTIDRDDVQMSTVGAAIIITVTCDNSHNFKWRSSAKVGDGKKRMFLINILLASYVVLCGLNIAQVSNKLAMTPSFVEISEIHTIQAILRKTNPP